MDVKLKIHNLMRLHFGAASCEASHKWLRANFGVCHVADLTQQQADRTLSRLSGKPLPVRNKTWEKISHNPKPDPIKITNKPIPRPTPKPILKPVTSKQIKADPNSNTSCNKLLHNLSEAAFRDHGLLPFPHAKLKLKAIFGQYHLWISLSPNGKNIAKFLDAEITDSAGLHGRFNAVIKMINFAHWLTLPQFVTECQLRGGKYIKHFNYKQLASIWEEIQKEKSFK